MSAMSTDMMEIMVSDWMTDHADEMSDLTVDLASICEQSGVWMCSASCGSVDYTLVAHDGDIAIYC